MDKELDSSSVPHIGKICGARRLLHMPRIQKALGLAGMGMGCGYRFTITDHPSGPYRSLPNLDIFCMSIVLHVTDS